MKRLSDEQVIERVRRWQRYRQGVGICCLIFGLLGAAAVAWMAYGLEEQAKDVFRQLAAMHEPTTRQMAETEETAQFSNGFAIGCLVAGGFACLIECVVGGLVLAITTDRKNQLLLKCWDERSQREGPDQPNAGA